MIEHLRGREKALEQLGLAPRQAEWVALAALHSGVFLRAQYTKFQGEHGAAARVRAQRLVDMLIGRGLARDAQLPGVGRVCRVTSKTVYRSLGAPDIRHRRDAATGDMLRRLLSLDCVVGREARHWLPTEPEKVEAFTGLGIERAILPKRVYGRSGGGRTIRYFGWKMPVAFDGRTALFVYVDAEGETYAGLLSWGAEHRALWSALKKRGMRVEVATVSGSTERLAGARAVLDRWGGSGLGKASGLSRAERAELSRIEIAASSVDLKALERLGGFQAALQRAAQLQRRAAAAREAPRLQIDGARTWLSDFVGARELA